MILYGRINFSEWEPDTTGATDITAKYVEAVNYVAEKHLRLEIGQGRYKFANSHITFNDFDNFAIKAHRNSIFVDEGRPLVGYSNSSFSVPYGVEFINCHDLMLEGGLYKSNVNSGGSSNGMFNTTTCSYEFRKPVLSFYECSDLYVLGVGRAGSPGRGISGFDLGNILTDLGLVVDVNLTREEYNYFSHRGHHRNFYRCNTVYHIGGWSQIGTGDREQISFTGGNDLYWMDEVHTNNTASPDMASLGKVIGSNRLYISGFRIKDPSDSSLIDIVANNVTVFDMYADIPNGKMIDISHEHGLGSTPMSNITIRDFRTTGRGPVSSVVNTPDGVVANTPITNIVIEDCNWCIGWTDYSNITVTSMGTVKDFTIRNRTGVNESPSGVSFTLGGGDFVQVANSSYTWTKNSSSLVSGNRMMVAGVRNEYRNVNIRQNASRANTGNGLAVLSFTTTNNGSHIFYGGSFVDSDIFIAGNENVMMINVTLNSFTCNVSNGSIKYIDCKLNGQLLNN